MTAHLQALAVFLHGTRVGTLQRNRSGLVRFHPDADWVGANQHPRLGRTFLENPGPRQSSVGLPHWFENLLPEAGSLLRKRLCARSQLKDADSFGLVRLLGHDLPGAVTIQEEDGPLPPDSFDVALPLQDDPGPGDPWRFSLAGVQLKFSLALHENKYVVPATNEHGRWILKVPPTSLPMLSRLEHATMAWARTIGLNVAETRVVPAFDVVIPDDLSSSDDTEFLAVRRFDRTNEGGRVHQEDFAQVLDWPPGSKYAASDGEHINHDGIARLLRALGDESLARNYIRQLAFVIACGNTDEHLKNWSLQWPIGGKRPVLSPAYDLVSLVSIPGYHWHTERDTASNRLPTLSLPFGKSRKLVTLNHERVRTFEQRSRFPGASSLIEDTLLSTRDTWPAVAHLAPPAMVEALQEHWRRVPLLQRLGPLPD